MSEDKQKLLAQINELPDKYKSFITGYAAGVIDAKAEKDKDADEDPEKTK